MKTHYLVSCVSKKQSIAAPSRDLYISEWFKKARSYVEATGDPWFILSAEHGLLMPDQIVSPYEKTLNTMAVNERQAWGRRVLQQLEEILSPGDTVIFFAGARYRQFLVDALMHRGVRVEIPLEGKRIGEQLQWLKEHTNE